MGRFKSNALVLRHRRGPQMNVIRGDSPVLLPRQVCNRPEAQKPTIRFFSERMRTPPTSFISKNEGMAEGRLTFAQAGLPPAEHASLYRTHIRGESFLGLRVA